jgi:hypothetical protein
VIQVAFGWTDSHLYELEVDGNRLGIPENDEFNPPSIDSRRTTLSQLLKPSLKFFLYRYDFGDDWEHEIANETRTSVPDIREFPICLDGARSAPPEDCGGAAGYEENLRILQDPKDPEYAETKEWMGEDFDPERFDIHGVNAALRRLRPRR